MEAISHGINELLWLKTCNRYVRQYSRMAQSGVRSKLSLLRCNNLCSLYLLLDVEVLAADIGAYGTVM